MKKSVVKFDAKKFATQMMQRFTDEQSARLIEYAKEKIIEIGDKIQSYNSKNHMDRTGHLLNSLCWCVTYGDKVIDSGFYRNVTLHKKGSDNTDESFLHEWSGDYKYAFPVDGRKLAEKKLKEYGGGIAPQGWRVIFAILAPYWGYWEEGFTLVHGFSNNNGKSKIKGATFKRFAVMAEFYDQVSKDLKPANVTYKTSSPKYSYSYTLKMTKGKVRIMGSLERAWKNRVYNTQYNKRRKRK